MFAPIKLNFPFPQLKLISSHFPKRLELLFRQVFELPKLSNKGFDPRTRSSMAVCPTEEEELILLFPIDAADKYCKHFFVVSVLPAPLSPLITIACLWNFSFNCKYAVLAIAQIWVEISLLPVVEVVLR